MLPRAVYRLNRGLRIANASDLVIDGQGSRFVFTGLTGTEPNKGNGIEVVSSARVTLRAFTVDFDPLPFTQGAVIQAADVAGGSYYDVRVDAGYRTDLAFFQENVSAAELSIHAFDAATRRHKPDVYWPMVRAVASPSAGVLRFSVAEPTSLTNIAVGDLLATAAWRADAIFMSGDDHMVLDDVTVHSAYGVAFGETLGGGATDARVCMTPGPPPAGATAERLFSGIRGGWDSNGMTVGPYIHDSLLERAGDDLIVVDGPLAPVVSAVGNALTLPGPWPVAAGDSVIVFAGKSWGIRAASTVTSASGATVVLADTGGAGAGDFFSDLRFAGLGARIENNVLRDGDASGIVVNSQGASVVGNTLERIYLSGVALFYSMGVWKVGPQPRDVTVRANHLSDVAEGRLARGGWAGLQIFVRRDPGERASLLGSRAMSGLRMLDIPSPAAADGGCSCRTPMASTSPTTSSRPPTWRLPSSRRPSSVFRATRRSSSTTRPTCASPETR